MFGGAFRKKRGTLSHRHKVWICGRKSVRKIGFAAESLSSAVRMADNAADKVATRLTMIREKSFFHNGLHYVLNVRLKERWCMSSHQLHWPKTEYSNCLRKWKSYSSRIYIQRKHRIPNIIIHQLRAVYHKKSYLLPNYNVFYLRILPQRVENKGVAEDASAQSSVLFTYQGTWRWITSTRTRPKSASKQIRFGQAILVRAC